MAPGLTAADDAAPDLTAARPAAPGATGATGTETGTDAGPSTGAAVAATRPAVAVGVDCGTAGLPGAAGRPCAIGRPGALSRQRSTVRMTRFISSSAGSRRPGSGAWALRLRQRTTGQSAWRRAGHSIRNVGSINVTSSPNVRLAITGVAAPMAERERAAGKHVRVRCDHKTRQMSATTTRGGEGASAAHGGSTSRAVAGRLAAASPRPAPCTRASGLAASAA